MNIYPWGRLYKECYQNPQGPIKTATHEQLTQIVTTLFPAQEQYDHELNQDESEDIPMITLEELLY